MKIQRTIEERLELGDDSDPSERIVVEAQHVEGTEVVSVSFRLGEDPKWFSFDAEVIERIAAALRERRRSAFESREVCPDHGAYRPDYESFRGACPKCETKKRAEDAQLRLANMGSAQP